MSISAILSTSVSGMQNASNRMAKVAQNVVPPESSTSSMEQNLYDMIGAKIDYQANASVFETGADMWDVLKTILRD